MGRVFKACAGSSMLKVVPYDRRTEHKSYRMIQDLKDISDSIIRLLRVG